KALGYKHLDVSEVSVLTQLSRVFMILYGVFIFGEYLSLENMFGSVFIIMGGILVTFNKGVFTLNKYVALMIIAAFAFATALVIDVGISEYFNLAVYLLIIFATPAIIVFFIEHKSIKKLKE
ncbi:MAG: EamA family transporter, partial [Patescibacteria group bacterium]|nr:EamA family transporter [Patescibacteria group bacterium]